MSLICQSIKLLTLTVGSICAAFSIFGKKNNEEMEIEEECDITHLIFSKYLFLFFLFVFPFLSICLFFNKSLIFHFDKT